MDGFITGMGSLDLFPPPRQYPNTSLETAWRDVGRAFARTGFHLRNAMNATAAAQGNQPAPHAP